MLSRREFLNFSAATIALTSLPNQIQSNQLIRNYKITAEITPHTFDKKGVLDSLWLYNFKIKYEPELCPLNLFL